MPTEGAPLRMRAPVSVVKKLGCGAVEIRVTTECLSAVFLCGYFTTALVGGRWRRGWGTRGSVSSIPPTVPACVSGDKLQTDDLSLFLPFFFPHSAPPHPIIPACLFQAPPPIQGHSSTIVLNPYSVSKASFKSVHRDSVNIYCIKWLHSKVNEGESVQICMTDTNLCTYVTETYLYME